MRLRPLRSVSIHSASRVRSTALSRWNTGPGLRSISMRMAKPCFPQPAGPRRITVRLLFSNAVCMSFSPSGATNASRIGPICRCDNRRSRAKFPADQEDVLVAAYRVTLDGKAFGLTEILIAQ